jgi:hypothetical protein
VRVSQILLVMCCSLCCDPTHSTASVVLPVGLAETVEASDLIIVGTVSRLEYVHLPGDVFTRVFLTRLNVAKGGVTRDSLAIQVPGGIWNGNAYKTVGIPEFEVGARYGLCLEGGLGSPEDHYHPIWNEGFFPILADSSGKSIVHDCHYFPIVGADNGHLLVTGIRARPKDVHDRMKSRAREFRGRGPARPDTLVGPGGTIARIYIPEELDTGTRLDEWGFVREIMAILQKK